MACFAPKIHITPGYADTDKISETVAKNPSLPTPKLYRLVQKLFIRLGFEYDCFRRIGDISP
jgi:hypothetical protein